MQRVINFLKKNLRIRKCCTASLAAERERLVAEVATYRHAFESTAVDRDRLAAELKATKEIVEVGPTKPVRSADGVEAHKHSFETAAGDHDRLAAQLETYKSALESTAADRNRIARILSEVANPLDAGNFRFDFSRFHPEKVAPEDAELIEALVKRFESGAYDEMIGLLLSNTKIGIAHVNDINYFKPFAAYYLGCLFATQNRFDKAAKFAELLEFDAPPDGTDFLPYDLRQGSRLNLYSQQIGLERGKPGAVIVSLTKSASSLLSTSISAALQIPILKLTIGQGARSVVVKRWADQVARGGATTHEHFRAEKINVETVRQSNIGTIWLQLRDPRDAAFSILRMRNEAIASGVIAPEAPFAEEAEQFAMVCQSMAGWIDNWLAVSRAKLPDLKINVITYAEVIGDTPGVIRRIFGDRLPDDAAKWIQEFSDRQGALPAGPNFRKGVGGEWRSIFDAKTRDRVWSQTPKSVKSALSLDR
ncbi:MAG: hypothetical protein Q8M24_09805 [Pseudolabrys sp.]|nr:hypothetical protein [Pseudolabrys sp.]MDP2295741.1 hypothetical protein [Pseudolabrys sp.]